MWAVVTDLYCYWLDMMASQVMEPTHFATMAMKVMTAEKEWRALPHCLEQRYIALMAESEHCSSPRTKCKAAYARTMSLSLWTDSRIYVVALDRFYMLRLLGVDTKDLCDGSRSCSRSCSCSYSCSDIIRFWHSGQNMLSQSNKTVCEL